MSCYLIGMRAVATLLVLSTVSACSQDVTEPERTPGAPGISLLATSNTWTLRAPMPTPRKALKAATVNGIIYAIGGFGFAPNLGRNLIRPKVEAYNPGTNSWSTKRGLPEPLEPTGATTINGKIYVAGGRSNERISKALYVYNPATNLWTRKADMPYKASTGIDPSNGAAFGGHQGAINGRLYVYLGATTNSDGTMGPQRFMRYTPSTNTWVTLKVPSFARVGGVSAVYNGRFYILGGVLPSDVGGRAADVHVYNPATGTWSKLLLRGNALATTGLAYATTGGKLYVTGSEYADGFSHLNSVYNPATNTLTELTARPRYARESAAGGAAKGQFYAIGGATCEQASGEVELCGPQGLSGAVEAYTP